MLYSGEWGVLTAPLENHPAPVGSPVYIADCSPMGTYYDVVTVAGYRQRVPAVAVGKAPPLTTPTIPDRGPSKRIAAAWPARQVVGRDTRRLVLTPPAVRDLDGELRAIKAEYGANGPVKTRSRMTRYGEFKWAVDFVTERIVLGQSEGVAVDLGPFKVSVGAIMTRETISSFRYVDALDPHPPLGNGGHNPHPHVSGRTICLGLGESDFSAAIRSGRIADAAHVVCSVLRTYLMGSAHVRISMRDWDGVPCSNCQTRQLPRSGRPPQCYECDGDVCNSCRSPSSCYLCYGRMHHGCFDAAKKCASDGCDARICRRCVADSSATHCVTHMPYCSVCFHRHQPAQLNAKGCCESCAPLFPSESPV